MLAQILQAYADNPEATAYLTGMRDLLTAARREGIAAAYARLTNDEQELPDAE